MTTTSLPRCTLLTSARYTNGFHADAVLVLARGYCGSRTVAVRWLRATRSSHPRMAHGLESTNTWRCCEAIQDLLRSNPSQSIGRRFVGIWNNRNPAGYSARVRQD